MNEEKPYDEGGFIMSFEGGECLGEEIIDGFQHLLDTGTVWKLQGCYGHLDKALIDAGHIRDRHAA